jgi:hypothetical protein
MSADKKTETPKQEPKPSAPETLITPPKKGDIELTEQELGRASGGMADGSSKDPAIKQKI